MAYNRTQASNLLSAEEMALFDASLADRVKALGAAELRKQVKRTRTCATNRATCCNARR